MGSVDDSQTFLFTTTQMLQFHYAPSTSTNVHTKPKIKNTELARCRVRTYCITAFKWM